MAAAPAPRTITEPAREIPVLLDTDVVVVGGGTTGPIAAIAAARQGARVALVERFGSLGGNLTLGLNTKPSGPLVGGVPRELWALAQSIGGAGDDYVAATKTGSMQIASPGDPEVMKMLLTRLCAESGVEILFETFVSLARRRQSDDRHDTVELRHAIVLVYKNRAKMRGAWR